MKDYAKSVKSLQFFFRKPPIYQLYEIFVTEIIWKKISY
jgi:hypothetical protein